MDNDPKWEVQTWMLPGAWGLVRRGKDWFFEGMQGAVKIQIDFYTGECLAEIIAAYQIKIGRKKRRSISFRWQRFWYMRKHKKPIKL